MRAKKTFYVWQCHFCQHRNKEVFNFHYNFPHNYHAVWVCSKCGSENYIDFRFRVLPITEKRDEGYYQRWGSSWG